MLIEYDGRRPRVADSAYLAPTAVVCGDVEIGADCRVLFGAVLSADGAGSEIRINAVVHVNSVVPEQTVVPIGWIAVGDPAQVFPPQAHDQLWPLQRDLDLPGTVFGLTREQLTMERVSAQYAELFGSHRSDRILDAAEQP